MKKTFTLFLFLLFCKISFAQINLVPNPSFEIFSLCPDNLDQVNRAVGWSSFGGSPDYYNACAPPWPGSIVSVPENYSGYQFPAQGNAYCGLYTYYINPLNYREYIGASLISPLQIGTTYCISFKVNLSLNLGTTNCASNKIGVLFSTINYSNLNPIPILNYSHVFTDSIINDTLNWITLEGDFLADSSYQYICIGNFFDNANTDTIQYYSLGLPRSYILIDDIKVNECDSINFVHLEGSNAQSIEIFPNPVFDSVNIKSEVIIDFIKIFDAIGKEIFISINNSKLESEIFSINLSSLAKGYYNLICYKDQVISIHKIIKL